MASFNLKTLAFTQGNDSYTGGTYFLGDGISADTVDTLKGSDSIDARSNTGSDQTGVSIASQATLSMADGDDSLTSTINGGLLQSYAAIKITGTLFMRGGIDNIFGKVFWGFNGNTSASGILNSGLIDTGIGNDTMNGSVTGGGPGTGIRNTGTIKTGAGQDVITGIASDTPVPGFDFGIYNGGTIDTGDAADIVDALKGGFGGTGLLMTGKGNDTVRGFGSGKFDGGANTDGLVFAGTGTYTVVSPAGQDGYFKVNFSNSPTTTMEVKNFETINGQPFVAGGTFIVV